MGQAEHTAESHRRPEKTVRGRRLAMLAPTSQKTFKVALVVVGMFLLLLAEPVLARKGGQKNNAPRGGNARSQQVRKAGAGVAAPTKAVQRSQPTQPRAVNSRTEQLGRPTFGWTGKAYSRQSWNANSSRPKVATPPAAFDAGKRAPGIFDAAKRTLGSFVAKKPKGSLPDNSGQRTVTVSKPNGQRAVARPAKVVNKPKPSKPSPEFTTKPATPIDVAQTARIASPIDKPKPAIAPATTVTGDRSLRITDGRTVQSNTAPSTKPRRVRIALKEKPKTDLTAKKVRLKSVDRIRVASETKKPAPQGRKTIRDTEAVSRTRNEIAGNTTVVADSQRPLRIDREGRSGRRDRQTRWGSTAGYDDRRHSTRRVHRYEHVYRDRRDRLCHRIVWPRYRFPVCYNWGSRFTFRYVYPYHHRRYVFVSLGGYWPVHYRYSRYYWYGCHPYDWYGYYPIAREVVGDTYNYYTYNYSYGEAPPAAYQPTDEVGVVDHTTFADVRERLAQQAAEPNAPTPADTYFEEAVKAFEESDYNTAAEKFAEAMELATEDMVLPFAYAQALFANGQYSEAADALRSALENVSPEAEGVFYPRGLYTEDEVLLEQIDLLSKAAEIYTSDADLQLLLGYQLLGIGEIDEALEPLQQAGLDLENKDSAEVLLNLLEKIKTEKPENADQ